VREILIDRQMDSLDRYVASHGYTEHNPRLADGIDQLYSVLGDIRSEGGYRIEYRRLHRVLAQGCFVLSVCEGYFDGVHSSFFDLFRVAEGRLVEHWDTTEAIPPRSEWKNDNGKF
jgi:predicted SnoaL-like aldol condensation-catalyzing enzyme